MTEREALEWNMLLKRRMELYSGGDTSAPIETVERVLASAKYCVEGYKRSLADKQTLLASEQSVSEMFDAGLRLQKQYVEEAKGLLDEVRATMLPIELIAYNDTVYHGIPPFFNGYDVYFAAHMIPGSIDYPLAADVTGLAGVEFIREYLKRLLWENKFCSAFAPHRIERLLQAYGGGWQELLQNIMEPVLANAIGCRLLDIDPLALVLDEEEVSAAENRLVLLPAFRACAVAVTAAQSVARSVGMEGREELGYIRLAAEKLMSRIGLQRVFIVC